MTAVHPAGRTAGSPSTSSRPKGVLPGHAARGRPVHLPGGVQVHVDGPAGADVDRFGGLRGRSSASPRKPAALRHAGASQAHRRTAKVGKEVRRQSGVTGAVVLKLRCSESSKKPLQDEQKHPSVQSLDLDTSLATVRLPLAALLVRDVSVHSS
ncbi:hypothetical protein MHYP_G00013020 [Metynnis hypsauchen]